MVYPISAAQQKHQRDNPVSNPNGLLEELLVLIAGQNGDLSDAIQNLVSGLPSTEVHFGLDPPDNPGEGDLWYHPEENRLYTYAE